MPSVVLPIVGLLRVVSNDGNDSVTLATVAVAWLV